ncbi:helix loop helix DNA-binding domain protein [Ceratobasidium sp. AG-Ba]|nr:helix loop helix DNA-binding domain protein [Ceratobasidium sp. AG-Ba]
MSASEPSVPVPDCCCGWQGAAVPAYCSRDTIVPWSLRRKPSGGEKPHPGSKSAREAMRKESHSRIEKRRREKINDTLTTLRQLIAQGEGVRREDSPPPTPEREFKLELLERTVAFVKGLLERTRELEEELAELKGGPPTKRKRLATPMSSPAAGPSAPPPDVDELGLDGDDDDSSALSDLEPEPEPEPESPPTAPRRSMSIAALLTPAMAPALPSPPPSGRLNDTHSETQHMETLSLPSPEVALRRSSISPSSSERSLKRPREADGDEDTVAAALLLQFSSKTPMSMLGMGQK